MQRRGPVYTTLLVIHSTVRWLVIFSGLATAALAIRAAAPRSVGPPVARAADTSVPPSVRAPAALAAVALFFTVVYDVQVLVGFLLFVRFSPITTTALHHMRAAMSNDVLRFWTVEHPTGMIVGLVFAHIGRAKLTRGRGGKRARSAAIFLALAILIVLLSIPWPFMPYGRALF